MILYSTDIVKDIEQVIASIRHDRLFLLMDVTTQALCLPLLKQSESIKNATPIVIEDTDVYKNIQTLTSVWQALVDGKATRHSLLVNLGGGMVTDLGGFAAATFKRGIRYINIPTTLLSMVDAAVGGKTGINFAGLKNEVGAFCDSQAVVIHTKFLHTLDAANVRSGFAEMLKHALLKDEEMWHAHLSYDLNHLDTDVLQTLVRQSIEVKSDIVGQDPHEQGLRKALNLGHTVGHAFESLALERGLPLLHGCAVAYGLACELYLSCRLAGFPESTMRSTFDFIKQHYGSFLFDCNDYEHLISLMQHDKKNDGAHINFTLLEDIGNLRLNSHATKEQIEEMFDFYTNV